jgi:hypothetical protein
LILEKETVKNTLLETCLPIQSEYGVDAEKLYDSVRRCARAIWYQEPHFREFVNIDMGSTEGLWFNLDSVYPFPMKKDKELFKDSSQQH